MSSVLPIGDKWRAQIRRRGHPQITRTFDKKSHAVAWAQKTEAALRAGEFSDPREGRDVTVGSVIERYRDEAQKVKAFGRTKLHVLGTLSAHLGSTPLPNVTSAALVAFAQRRIAAGAGGVTVGMDLNHLAAVFKFARALWRTPTPVQAVADARELLRHMGVVFKSNSRKRRPTQEEIDRLCAHFEGQRKSKLTSPMPDILRFAVATAMRAGEIAGLRWEDLNAQDKTILIRDRKHPNEKMGNDQVVPLLAVSGLDAFEIAQRQPKTHARIFPFNCATWSSIFPRACQALGIEDLHLHDLRHEGVSRLFEAGYRIEQVALVSGHRDWAQLKRYTQVVAKNLHRKPHASEQAA